MAGWKRMEAGKAESVFHPIHITNYVLRITTLTLCALLLIACSEEQGNYTVVNHDGEYLYGVWKAQTPKAAKGLANQISQTYSTESSQLKPLPILTNVKPIELLPTDDEASGWVWSWKLLFSVPLKFQSDLKDGGTLPKVFREKFNQNGVSISQDATISFQQRGQTTSGGKWLITDPENQHKYTIRAEKNRLNIYSRRAGTYIGEKLYEDVFGAEPGLYYTYGFVEQANVEYQNPRLGGHPLILVEIFDMGSPENAFGVYSFNRYPHDTFEWVGNKAIISGEQLSFWKGKYFIQIEGYEVATEIKAGMVALAETIAKQIKEPPKKPHLLKLLPEKGRTPNSEKYFASSSAFHKMYPSVLPPGTKVTGVTVGYPHKSSSQDWMNTMTAFVIRFENESAAQAAYKAYHDDLQTYALSMNSLKAGGFIANEPQKE